MSGEWRTGFCDCCGSMSDCLIGYFLPPVEALLAARNAGKGLAYTILQCVFYPLLLPCLRLQVREERGIRGSCIRDFCSGWFCPCCISIQIKREFD